MQPYIYESPTWLLFTGDAALSFSDTTLAAETCEELFTPRAPHIALSLSGIEIISNGSGSHHQLRCFAKTCLLITTRINNRTPPCCGAAAWNLRAAMRRLNLATLVLM